VKFVQDLFKSKYMWIGLGVGLVLAVAYGRFVRKAVSPLANALPGSDAKQG
jgi:hypothetical protein